MSAPCSSARASWRTRAATSRPPSRSTRKPAILGRASTLTNIGSLCARQRRFQEGLESLEQARILYLESGARGRGLEAVEKLIARLRRRLAQPPGRKKP
jgi:hypothetical protein